jgi:hypothetical protein
MRGYRGTVMERFMRKVSIVPITGCWMWTGAMYENGYAAFCAAKGTTTGHRVAHELFKGPIAPGLTIDHLCRHRWCVNPSHLEAVTQAVNNSRSDGPTAVNGRKTSCHRGHPFDEENTYRKPDGRRNCRLCHCIEAKAFRQRQRAEVKP